MGEDEEAIATEDGFGPVDRGRLLDQVRLPMAAFDPVRNASGEIVDFSWAYANEAALALTTFRWDDVVGRNFSDTVPLEAGVSLAGYINAYETGSSFTAEMPFSGRPFDGWLAIRAERIDDLMVTRFEDVTEVKRLAGEKDEALATVQKVLGRITDAMYAVDRDWRFTMLNASAERLLGR